MDKIASFKLFNSFKTSRFLGRLASLATLGFIACSTSAYAAPDMYLEDSILSRVNWQVEPYVGADAFTRVMRYKSEPTHPFQEHLDTFQPFVGVRLHKYFGVEVGYQQSEKGTKERFFGPGEAPMFFGGGPMQLTNVADWLGRFDINTTTEIKGWNIGLIGFYPICGNKTELFAKVGYSNLDIDTAYRFDIRLDNLLAGGVANFSDMAYDKLHDDAGMIHLGVGIKHSFTHRVGGRAFINYEKTARLRLDSSSAFFNRVNTEANNFALGSTTGRNDSIRIRPRDSWSVGVGAYYTWK